MAKQLFNMERVEPTAMLIASELKTFLDRTNFESQMSQRIRRSPTYRDGLTNGEALLARLRALNMVQLEISAELASLQYEHDEDAA